MPLWQPDKNPLNNKLCKLPLNWILLLDIFQPGSSTSSLLKKEHGLRDNCFLFFDAGFSLSFTLCLFSFLPRTGSVRSGSLSQQSPKIEHGTMLLRLFSDSITCHLPVRRTDAISATQCPPLNSISRLSLGFFSFKCDFCCLWRDVLCRDWQSS